MTTAPELATLRAEVAALRADVATLLRVAGIFYHRRTGKPGTS